MSHAVTRRGGERGKGDGVTDSVVPFYLHLINEDEFEVSVLSLVLRTNGLEVVSYPSLDLFSQSNSLLRHACVLLRVSVDVLDQPDMTAYLDQLAVTCPVILLIKEQRRILRLPWQAHPAISFVHRPVSKDALLDAIAAAQLIVQLRQSGDREEQPHTNEAHLLSV